MASLDSSRMENDEPLTTVEDPTAPSGVGFGDGGDALIADIGPISPRRAPPDQQPPLPEQDLNHGPEEFEPLVDLSDIPDLAMDSNADTSLPGPPRTGTPPSAEGQPRSPPPVPPQPPNLPTQIGQPESGPTAETLSMIGELKNLVDQVPKEPPSAYQYKHGDSASYVTEIEEWFVLMNLDELEVLHMARSAFKRRWKVGSEHGPFWSLGGHGASDRERARFIRSAIHTAETGKANGRRQEALLCLLSVALGDWRHTPGYLTDEADDHRFARTSEQMTFDGRGEASESRIYRLTDYQRRRMIEGAGLLAECEAVPVLYDIFRELCAEIAKPLPAPAQPNGYRRDAQEEEGDDADVEEEEGEAHQTKVLLEVVMLTLYLLVEAGRKLGETGDQTVRTEFVSLEPDFLPFLAKTLASTRFDEASSLPVAQLVHLYWKSILLLFGSSIDLLNCKRVATKKAGLVPLPSKKQIRSSPMDYHSFRQEINSKFPGYQPPSAELPLEPDETNILPAFAEAARKQKVKAEATPVTFNPGTSLFDQPVHIATPAPSPPPTPAGAGKALRKINYQTNQQFPMLHPPVNVDGDPFGDSLPKGLPEYDLKLRWDEEHVPASILEAGSLFSQHSQLTLASKQMWDEKEAYLAQEKLQPSGRRVSRMRTVGNATKIAKPADGELAEIGEDDEDEAEERLGLVDKFYHDAFPHLNSLINVLFRRMWTDMMEILRHQNGTATNGLNTTHPSSDDVARPPGLLRTNASLENVSRAGPAPNGSRSATGESAASQQDPVAAQSREITVKATSAVFLSMLRWFKVSHVLKFEYLSQLLFDIDFVFRSLQFVNQDLDASVNSALPDLESALFYFFLVQTGSLPEGEGLNGGAEDEEMESEEDDPACPPPIRRNRDAQAPPAQNEPTAQSGRPAQHSIPVPPEVDELGNPLNAEAIMPSAPCTHFSFRILFSCINLLQTIQKLTKHKTHRIVTLVNHKFTQLLRRALRIPQPDIRLYALKLFKTQVPFCGRKWRQGNMRVITAVYLYCWPELRDEWLAGGDVEGKVEEALAVEQSLRALTHWFNVQRCPEAFKVLKTDGSNAVMRKEEDDFFTQELEKMGLGPTAQKAALEALADDDPPVATNGGPNGNHGVNGTRTQDGQMPVGGAPI